MIMKLPPLPNFRPPKFIAEKMTFQQVDDYTEVAKMVTSAAIAVGLFVLNMRISGSSTLGGK